MEGPTLNGRIFRVSKPFETIFASCGRSRREESINVLEYLTSFKTFVFKNNKIFDRRTNSERDFKDGRQNPDLRVFWKNKRVLFKRNAFGFSKNAVLSLCIWSPKSTSSPIVMCIMPINASEAATKIIE